MYTSFLGGFNGNCRFQVLFARPRKSCSVHERREADPLSNFGICSVVLGEFLLLFMIGRKFESAVEQRGKVYVIANHLTRCRRVSAVQKISAAEFFRT